MHPATAPPPAPPTPDPAPARGPAPPAKRGAFRLAYDPALDGLRAAAVLCVMFAHLSLLGAGFDLHRSGLGLLGLRGGFLGVDVFFVLSGFLITALLLKEHGQTGRINLPAFYGRRALRLLPALALVLAASCLCVAFRLGAGDGKPVLRGAALALCCSVNTYFCVRGAHAGMLTHAWSLGVEEKFYFVWPVLLWGLLRLGVRRRRIVLLVAVGVGASAGLRAACWRHGGAFALRVGISSLPARADNLLVGSLLALWACWRGLPGSAGGRLALRAGSWGAGALLAWMVYSCGPGPAVYLVAGAASALLIGGLVAGSPRALRGALASPPVAWVGRVSYGLYLWHVPVFCLAPLALDSFFGRGGGAVPLACGMAFGLTFAAAAASHYLVERPFLRWKARLARA